MATSLQNSSDLNNERQSSLPGFSAFKLSSLECGDIGIAHLQSEHRPTGPLNQENEKDAIAAD